MTSGTPKERWCNWKGETTDWAGPLPSLEMVSSGMVFASPDQLRFRDPKAFFPGNVHNNISLWQQIMPGGRPKSDEILKYLELGVDVTDFFTPLKGIFQGKFYDHPTPPQAWFPNSKSCIPFDNFVTETILSRVSNRSLLVWGKVGDIEPPTIVMPITVEPGKPRMCHDERYLNCWIRDLPFSLDLISDLPRYLEFEHYQSTCDDKSGYDHILLSGISSAFFGLEWKVC